MARVLADDDDPPVPADHFALLTHRLDAGSNLHVLVLLWYSSVSYCSGGDGWSPLPFSNTCPSHLFPDASRRPLRPVRGRSRAGPSVPPGPMVPGPTYL